MGGSGDKKSKKKNKNNMKKSQAEQIPTITDPRFASAMSDPRFMQAPKKRSKVEIDSRFSRAFTDRNFASNKAPVDKRGKRRTGKGKCTSSLAQYYRLEQDEVKKTVAEEKEDDDDESEGDSESESLSGSESEKLKTVIEEDEDEDDEKLKTEIEDEDDEMESVDELDSTDTGTDTDTDSGFEEEEEEEVPEEDVPDIDKETKRLAVVNLDWTEVRASDIYVVLDSFLPKGGQIMSVSVYPSEFGLKRMEEEAVRGPVGLFDDEKEKEDEDEDDDDDEIDSKKIREYELSRLRYYYAVVECDSVATADHLYKSCDGIEFERSANKLDLRFIPDSMEFKHEPRDVATEKPADYDGLDFQTRALQHSNIHISWDEDGPQRSRTLKRLLKSDQPADSELHEFLATDESGSDDDDDAVEEADDDEDRIPKKRKRHDKYRALIGSGNGSDEDDEEDNDQDMEVTFNSGLEDISKRLLEKKDKKSESVWEETLRKRREKKKARKNRSKNSSDDESDDNDRGEEQPDDFFVEESADDHVHSSKAEEMAKEAVASQAELELLLADDKGANSNLKGFNLKPKKKDGKKKKEIPDEKLPTIDYSDPRFSVLMTNPLFALDPTDPQFKRSATYVRQVAEKEKKGDTGNADRSVISEVESEMPESETVKNATSATRKENHEISSLVKSIKMKSKNLPSQPERKVRSSHKLKANIRK